MNQQGVLWFGALLLGVAVFTHGSLVSNLQSAGVPIEFEVSSRKPFGNASSFYPFYLAEHSDPTCRLFHFIGTNLVTVLTLVLEPVQFISLAIAAATGLICCELFRFQSTGLLEMAVMLIVYFSLNKKLTGYLGIQPLLIGYGMAWIGHFVFEKNQPATFIYPSYSLLSDYRMLIDIYAGKLSIALPSF